MAAGLGGGNGLRTQDLDGLGGRGVHGLGLLIVQVVTEVRADQDQRLLAAPQARDDLSYLFGSGADDQEGDDVERLQGQLQKGQLDLEAMLALERRLVAADLGQGSRTFAKASWSTGTAPSGARKVVEAL